MFRGQQEDDRPEAEGHNEEVLAERGALPSVSPLRFNPLHSSRAELSRGLCCVVVLLCRVRPLVRLLGANIDYLIE